MQLLALWLRFIFRCPRPRPNEKDPPPPPPRHGPRGARAGAPDQRRTVHQVIRDRRVEHRGRVELLPGNGRADDRKDARADHRADAQQRQRHGAQRLAERVLRELGLCDQLVDGLAGEKLVRQRRGLRGFRKRDYRAKQNRPAARS